MAIFSFTQSGFEAYQGVINVADTTVGSAISISATKQVLPAATGQDFGSTSLRWDPFLGATDIAGAVTADASIWNIGSGQFYKDASGNIGIGTAAPGAPLHVQKSLAGALLISLENTSNSASANARFLLKNDSGVTAGFQFLSSTATTPSLLTFYNAANAPLAFSTNAVERGRFTATGELVLGNGDTSATPTSSTLRGTNGTGTDIAGASVTVLAGRGTGAGAPGSLNFQTATVGTTGSVLQTATTRMTISATAITTTLPISVPTTANTQIGGTSGSTGRMLISGSTSTADAACIVLRGATAGANPGCVELWTTDGTTGTAKLTMTSTGNGLPAGSGTQDWGALALRWNNVHAYNFNAANSILVVGATSGVGYGTGAGGTVTQLTSKATGVTLSKPTGQITTAADALAAGALVSFTLTNTLLAATDCIHVQRQSGGTAGAYRVWVDSVAAGSCVVCIENRTAGSLSEALVLNMNLHKGVAA